MAGGSRTMTCRNPPPNKEINLTALRSQVIRNTLHCRERRPSCDSLPRVL
jgi:hypothetical protein